MHPGGVRARDFSGSPVTADVFGRFDWEICAERARFYLVVRAGKICEYGVMMHVLEKIVL